MKIVLLQSVDNLGIAGEAVEVRPGYYRNYLGPRGIALPATKGNLKLVEAQRKRLEAQVAREKSEAHQLRDLLHGTALEFHLRANDKGQLFGSITTMDIGQALAAAGKTVDRRKIEIGEPIKTLGDHKVRVRLYTEVYAELKVTVSRLVRPGDEEEEVAAAPAATAAE